MSQFELTPLTPTRASILQNTTCVYCATALTKESATKEHVIGRRFVPRGSLNRAWNLIVNACGTCNRTKSDLEDDLSAITMQRNVWGAHATEDPELAMDGLRKGGRSFSRRTGKPIASSAETVEIKVPLGPGLEATFTGIVAPQPDYQRVADLARLQMMGFFYFITYDDATTRGGYWQGTFGSLNAALRGDWGNADQRGFADLTATWEPRLIVVTGNEYFKALIRRHPRAEAWSWALEWNQSLRSVGFFGDEAAVSEAAASIDPPVVRVIPQPNGEIRMREDVELADEDDKLFRLP